MLLDVATLEEGVNNSRRLTAFALLLLELIVGDNSAELLGLFLKVNVGEKESHCLLAPIPPFEVDATVRA